MPVPRLSADTARSITHRRVAAQNLDRPGLAAGGSAAPPGFDYAWAKATGGALTSAQRRQLLTPLAHVVVSHAIGRLRVALGWRGAGGIDLDRMRWPDSQLARDAEQQAREELSPHMLQHSYRTFLFGLALAALDDAPVDHELVYVASLLHDLNLERPTPGRCFAVVGGERAEQFALQRGVSSERAAAIGAAISGHITVGAAGNLADPAGFVSAGAFVDVAGVRLHELHPAWVEQVLRRHPRLGFRGHLLTAFAAEAAAVPDGRIHWCLRYAGFKPLVRLAPFAE